MKRKLFAAVAAALLMVGIVTPAAEVAQIQYRCQTYVNGRVVTNDIVPSSQLGWYRFWHPTAVCGCAGVW